MGPKFLLSIMAVVSLAGCSTDAKNSATSDRSAANSQTPNTGDASKAVANPGSQILTASADQATPAPDANTSADANAVALGTQPDVAPADSNTGAPTTPIPVANAAGTMAAATPAAPVSNVVNFSIKVGTGKNPWNSSTTPVVVKVGQVIHVTNDDTIVHQMHTFGNPCPHGAPIAPGKSADCKVGQAIDTVTKPGLLYDHTVGSSALFYVTATK